jgi:hypothetical protein
MQQTAARARLIESLGLVLADVESRPSPRSKGAYELLGTSRRIPSARVQVVLPPGYKPDDLDSPVAVIVQLGASTTSAETCIDQVENTILAIIRAQQQT